MNSIDYLILAIYLALILGIGFYFRVRDRSHEAFFLAGRRMGWLPIGLSVMVTVFSAVNYVALPNEVFGYGLYVTVALPVFFLMVWPISRIWMPMFHRMRITSAYEYLERRFDRNVRSLGGGIFILWRLFWMATALYAAGNIMGAITGMAPSHIILVGGLAATAYTALGGMRAVMWTDAAQFCVLFGGIVLGLVFATGEGGIAGILETAKAGGRLKPFVPFDPAFISLSPFIRMTLWSGLLGVFVTLLSRYGADQVVMQRYFSARSLKAAQRGLWLSVCVSVLSLAILVVFGLAVYAHAVQAGMIDAAAWETLTPFQRKGIAMRSLAGLIRSFPSGVTGLVAAGLLAATMSSIDSGINACSAVYVSDFHNRLFGKTGSADAGNVWLDRGLTLGAGLISTGLAFVLIPLVGHNNSIFMIANKVVNALGSPLLALFLIGMFSRWGNAPGALYGGVIGIIASLCISLFLQGLSLQYYSVATLLATGVPCYLISKIAAWRGHEQPLERFGWTWAARRGIEAKTTAES